MHDKLPPCPNIRAVFLDIDGTLIGADNRVSQRVKDAISAAREKGVAVAICSGRSRFTAQPIAEQIGPPLGYAVVSNGGVVINLDTGEVLQRKVLSIALALEIIRLIVGAGGEPYVYEDSITSDVNKSRVLHHPDLPVGPFATPPRYRPDPRILEELPFHPVSIGTFGPPARILPMVELLRAELPVGVTLIQSGAHDYWGIEIFGENVSKSNGLAIVAERLEVAREETMAIGDHINDVEMIEWAGFGVAMGNAIPEIKAVADWITDTQEEDGVASAIEQFVLRSGETLPACLASNETGKVLENLEGGVTE